jgi:hypothetical protein
MTRYCPTLLAANLLAKAILMGENPNYWPVRMESPGAQTCRTGPGLEAKLGTRGGTFGVLVGFVLGAPPQAQPPSSR